jgi:hypothetical protein
MPSKTTTQGSQALDPPADPHPAVGHPPHRQRELAEPRPEDERPEHFVEVDGRLVPEGDLMSTQPLPTVR